MASKGGICDCVTRRGFLAGGAALAIVGPACASEPAPVFCVSDSPLPASVTTHSSSGNAAFDRAMIAELKKILTVFPISPGFKFIDDPKPNAFAMPGNVVPQTKGTVLLGLNLLRNESTHNEFGDVAIAGICAHECGHIYQFDTGYHRYLASDTAQLTELHADYLAGYYLGRDRSHSIDQVLAFARSLFSHGDYNFNSPRHHGTPTQRVLAMGQGYLAGYQNVDLATAARRGADLVREA